MNWDRKKWTQSTTLLPSSSVSLWCYCWCRCQKHTFSNMATASCLKALKTTGTITAWSSNPDLSAVKRQCTTAGCISRQVLLLSDPIERMLVFNRLKSRWWEETHINEGTDFDTTPERSASGKCLSVHSCFTSVSITLSSPSLPPPSGIYIMSCSVVRTDLEKVLESITFKSVITSL